MGLFNRWHEGLLHPDWYPHRRHHRGPRRGKGTLWDTASTRERGLSRSPPFCLPNPGLQAPELWDSESVLFRAPDCDILLWQPTQDDAGVQRTCICSCRPQISTTSSEQKKRKSPLSNSLRKGGVAQVCELFPWPGGRFQPQFWWGALDSGRDCAQALEPSLDPAS